MNWMRTTPHRRAAVALAAAATLLAGLPGLSGTSAAAAADLEEGSSAARVLKDIAYTDPVPATTKGNLLDLYLPAHASDTPVPLFIYTEGSAWFADTGKETAGAWAEQLNPLGYAVAGVSVRSSSQVQFPGQLYDIKSAIRFLRANAGDYGIDAKRFAVGGFSSGAWTAAMAGVTNNVSGAIEGSQGTTGVSSRVQAVVTFSAPVAFKLMDSQATQYTVLKHGVPDSPESLVTGCTEYPTGVEDPACTAAERANPINYVTKDDPPFLMFHGSNDQLLPPAQSQVLFDELADSCVDAEFHLVQGPDHQYAYIQNPGEDPVIGQTVEKVDRSSCAVRTTEGLTEANTPSYALVASFLDRTIGDSQEPPTTQQPKATSTRLSARPSRQVLRSERRVRLVARVSRPRLAAGGTVRFADRRHLVRSVTVDRSGRAVMRLPRSTSVGVHPIRAVFSGTKAAGGSRSKVVRVRVVDRRHRR